MSTSRGERSWGRHVFALLCSTAFLAAVPTVAYAGVIIWSGDLGGPLNFIIIPVGCVLLGSIPSLIIFMPLGLVSERFGVQRILSVVSRAALALLIIAGGALGFRLAYGSASRWGGIISGSGFGLVYLLIGFLIYLYCLAFRRNAGMITAVRSTSR